MRYAHAATQHGHRIPASRVVTIARYAPLGETGCPHHARFLQKRKNFFARVKTGGDIDLIQLADSIRHLSDVAALSVLTSAIPAQTARTDLPDKHAHERRGPVR